VDRHCEKNRPSALRTPSTAVFEKSGCVPSALLIHGSGAVAASLDVSSRFAILSDLNFPDSTDGFGCTDVCSYYWTRGMETMNSSTQRGQPVHRGFEQQPR
jgi:hypothetical protein